MVRQAREKHPGPRFGLFRSDPQPLPPSRNTATSRSALHSNRPPSESKVGGGYDSIDQLTVSLMPRLSQALVITVRCTPAGAAGDDALRELNQAARVVVDAGKLRGYGCVVLAVTSTSDARLPRAASKSRLLHASTWARAMATAGDSI